MSAGLQLAITGLLVLLNGFFVAAEFALVKVRASRIEELANAETGAARMTQHALRHLDVYLSASQVGISLASIALGWIGEPAVAYVVEPILEWLHLPTRFVHPLAFGLALGIVTATHIVVGEQAPKYWAIQEPEKVALACAYPLHVFYWICRPAIGILNASSNLVLRLLRVRTGPSHDLVHSEEELRLILAASGQGGVLNATEVDLVQHVFAFADKVASDIMSPRVDMVYLDLLLPLEQNLEIARTHTYTRYPLCEGSPDRVVGMVHVKDLMSLASGGGDLMAIRREMLFVPETKSIDQLLREFQRRKRHMATVVDEYGGTAGILTLEDILEEIVGEIHDEFEEARPEFQRLGDGDWLVDGRAQLADLKSEHNIVLANGSGDTLAGWVLDRVGAIPITGTVIEAEEYRVEVSAMEGQRVRTVRIRRLAAGEKPQSQLDAVEHSSDPTSD